jgi:hypothetical protein
MGETGFRSVLDVWILLSISSLYWLRLKNLDNDLDNFEDEDMTRLVMELILIEDLRKNIYGSICCELVKRMNLWLWSLESWHSKELRLGGLGLDQW